MKIDIYKHEARGERIVLMDDCLILRINDWEDERDFDRFLDWVRRHTGRLDHSADQYARFWQRWRACGRVFDQSRDGVYCPCCHEPCAVDELLLARYNRYIDDGEWRTRCCEESTARATDCQICGVCESTIDTDDGSDHLRCVCDNDEFEGVRTAFTPRKCYAGWEPPVVTVQIDDVADEADTFIAKGGAA